MNLRYFLFSEGSVHFVYSYLLLLIVHSVSSECVTVNPCQCVFKDDALGTGIDLNGIGLLDTNTLNATGISVIFNPCFLVSLDNYEPVFQSSQTQIINSVENKCGNHSSICLSIVQVKLIDLGSYDQFQFQTSGDGNVSLVSHYGGWFIQVKLECDNATANSNNRLILISSNMDRKILELLLISQKACPRLYVKLPRSSGWKTFIVLVFVLVFLYFVGGMLLKRIILDASGVEMIPNHLFWISLYSTMSNAITYLFNGCKHPSPYDEI